MCVVEQGRLIHDKLIRNGFERDCELRNALIDMYSKCRSMNEARNVFDRIVHVQEVVAWNSLIGGYSLQGQSEHVLRLFRVMQKEGTIPDKVTCAYTLKACASMEALDDGRLVHEEAVKTGIEMDVVVGSTIVDMYCKCKSLKDGRKVFEGMRGRNLVSWNAIIAGHVQQHGEDHSTAALELFEQMQLQGVEPNHVTLSCILKACSNLGDINSSRVIHDRIVRSGAGIDAILVCTVVDVYSKCGSLEEARWAFDRLPDRNAAAWAALIAGYADHGHTLHSLQLFQQMQEEGLKPDKVTYLCVLNAVSLLEAAEDGNLIHDRLVRDSLDRDIVIGNTLIDMYAKCNKLGDARRVFDGLPWRDIVSWGAVITGCVHCGDGAAALELYEEMEMEGEKPEKSTYLCILRACGSVGALEEGNVVHEKIVRQCLDSDPVISNTLVDMYAKCGEIKDAEKVFRGLCSKDVVSWNAVLAGHALHGNYGVVRQYLQDMESYGLNPDDRTYTSILASCGHAGALQECLDFFNAMDGVDPCLEHFNCVIDVFARFGCLTDAEEILQSIPSSPDSTSWVSLLSSCKVHGDPRTGGQCFDQVLLEA
jgi:pentatricopeptide repeat protein